MIATSPDSRHLTASMVVLDPEADAVLLVWHLKSELWLFPGGHVDPDESPAEAAVREVLEETGVHARIVGEPVDLPGMQWLPSPWLTAVIPAPAWPERPGKPAEPAHTHIDELFVGTADSTARITEQLEEVAAASWVPLSDLDGIGARAEVPQVARLASLWVAGRGGVR